MYTIFASNLMYFNCKQPPRLLSEIAFFLTLISHELDVITTARQRLKILQDGLAYNQGDEVGVIKAKRTCLVHLYPVNCSPKRE